MAITYAGLELTSNPEDKNPFHKKQQLAIAPNTDSDEGDPVLIYANQWNRKKLRPDSAFKEATIQDAIDRFLQQEFNEEKLYGT